MWDFPGPTGRKPQGSEQWIWGEGYPPIPTQVPPISHRSECDPWEGKSPMFPGGIEFLQLLCEMPAPTSVRSRRSQNLQVGDWWIRHLVAAKRGHSTLPGQEVLVMKTELPMREHPRPRECDHGSGVPFCGDEVIATGLYLRFSFLLF